MSTVTSYPTIKPSGCRAANEKLVAIKIAAESAILRRVAAVHNEKFSDKFFVICYKISCTQREIDCGSGMEVSSVKNW